MEDTVLSDFIRLSGDRIAPLCLRIATKLVPELPPSGYLHWWDIAERKERSHLPLSLFWQTATRAQRMRQAGPDHRMTVWVDLYMQVQ